MVERYAHLEVGDLAPYTEALPSVAKEMMQPVPAAASKSEGSSEASENQPVAAPANVFASHLRHTALARLRHNLAKLLLFGAPGRIRTHDPLVRSQVLYPTELRARRRRV